MQLYNYLNGTLSDELSIGQSEPVSIANSTSALELKTNSTTRLTIDKTTGAVSIPSGSYFYLRGNLTTDGSVRLSSQSDGSLSVENRISGQWVEASSFGGNYVTLDTDQIITGQKSFNSIVKQMGQDVNPDINVDHENGFISDSLPAGDSNYMLASDGVIKWSNQIYRNEDGRFYYLYNYDSGVENMVYENSGRTGLNKPSNILDKHASFTGTIGVGLNDMTVSGVYTNDDQVWYYVYISNAGTPDAFKWRKSLDDRVTWTSYSPAIPITTEDQLLENGVYVKFANSTGHVGTTANSWEFIATPQSPQGTFTVHPSKYMEILTTADYLANPLVYRNCSSELMNMIDNTTTGTTILEASSTTSALYVASKTKYRAVFFNLKTFGSNCTLVADYWNGSTWSPLTITDGTRTATGANSLKQHGNVTWNKPNDWALNSNITGEELYWIRFRTSTAPVTAPTARSLTRNGDRRFAVYAAPFDYAPSFCVDSRGNTVVGNSNGISTKLLTVSDVRNPTSTAGGGGISCVLSAGGGIYMKQDSIGAEAKYEMFSGLLHVGTMTNHPMSLWTMNLERARISNLTGNMGIGTTIGSVVTQPEGRLHVRTDAAYSTVPLMERNLQTTDTLETSLVLLSTKTTDMADGFGTALEFSIRDNAGVRNTIAKIGAERAGADTTGNLIGYVTNAGVSTEVVRFKPDGTQTLKIGDSSISPSASTEGTFRYRKTSSPNTSNIDVVMQTGSGTYEWVNVLTNSW